MKIIKRHTYKKNVLITKPSCKAYMQCQRVSSLNRWVLLFSFKEWILHFIWALGQ
jgi:hypothetical protein